MDYGIYAARLETRQAGDGREITGVFPYAGMAVIAASGRVRKERIAPHAFDFSINDAAREVNLLVGHSYDRPLASKQRGSLEFDSQDDALSFRAVFPTESRQPSWVRDALLAIDDELMLGLSPGFVVPPASAVPNAESLSPEPGNPSVSIRTIRQALLLEMSVVTRGAYSDAAVALRDEQSALQDLARDRTREAAARWL